MWASEMTELHLALAYVISRFRICSLLTEVWTYCAVYLHTQHLNIQHGCAVLSNRGSTTDLVAVDHLLCKKFIA